MVMSIKEIIRVLKRIDKDINNATYSFDTLKDIDKVITALYEHRKGIWECCY